MGSGFLLFVLMIIQLWIIFLNNFGAGNIVMKVFETEMITFHKGGRIAFFYLVLSKLGVAKIE